MFSLSPIHHIKGKLTEENEVYIYNLFNKVDQFYKNKMNEIVSDYITQYNTEDIRLVYAQPKAPSSFRRKTRYMIKPFYKQKPYLNDMVRCSVVFKTKSSLMAFNDYFKAKYGHLIMRYENSMENKAVRFKVIVIKYAHLLPHFSMNVYTNTKCFLYPFLEIQLHLQNHFNYQSMTHWLYDGYRCLKIIEINYNRLEFFTAYDYLNDTMSIHPVHILYWINRVTNKNRLSNFELLLYRTKYYLVNKMHFFIHQIELKQFTLKYLMICRMFLYFNVSNDQTNQNQLNEVIKIKQAINDLLLHIHTIANRKDMNN